MCLKYISFCHISTLVTRSICVKGMSYILLFHILIRRHKENRKNLESKVEERTVIYSGF